MACNTILYQVSDTALDISLGRSDRLSAIELEMGRELAEPLIPLLADEFAGRRTAAGDARQSGVACAAGSSS